MGIARSVRHSAHGTRSGKALRILCRIGCYHARVIEEVDFKRRVELEEAAKLRLPDIVEAGFEAMVAHDDGKVVAKLPFLLDGLLRHVRVRTEADGSSPATWESERWNLLLRVDQVVPILVAHGNSVDQAWCQNRVQGSVADNEVVGGEVAGRQIVGAGGLVVVPGVALPAVADKQTMLVVEAMVIATRITPIEVRRRNRRNRVRTHQRIRSVLDDGELSECLC